MSILQSRWTALGVVLAGTAGLFWLIRQLPDMRGRPTL